MQFVYSKSLEWTRSNPVLQRRSLINHQRNKISLRAKSHKQKDTTLSSVVCHCDFTYWNCNFKQIAENVSFESAFLKKIAIWKYRKFCVFKSWARWWILKARLRFYRVLNYIFKNHTSWNHKPKWNLVLCCTNIPSFSEAQQSTDRNFTRTSTKSITSLWDLFRRKKVLFFFSSFYLISFPVINSHQTQICGL